MKNFNEKKLVSKLDKILKKEFGTNLGFREFSAGYGIADLVFAQDFSFKKNVVKREPITNFNNLKILLTLEDKKAYTISEIISIFPQLSTSEIKKQLRILVANNYIEKIDIDTYVKSVEQEKINPIKKVIAIEVKLSDHRNGLIQARRYKYFADESYLAILKEAEKNIDFTEFNKHNIGLILFDNKTNSIEIKYPQQASCTGEDSLRLFAKEMMLSKFMKFGF